MATITDPSHVPLSGRGAELERLEAALAGARAQRPTLVVVDGPGGIGKTALLRSFVEGCDAQVLWSSGETFERAVPFAIADQLLRLARPGCAGASVMTIGAAHYTSVGLTILEALGELQRTGPVVVVVDDAHWADPASLRALLFAFRRLVTDAVLLVLTARSEDLHALPDGFLRIAQSPQGVELSLGPLGLDDARALVRGRELPLSGPAIARVHNLSAGVPLHLCALLDEFGADGDLTHLTAPPSYAALIVGRLSELRDDTRRLVEAAAVVGRRATIDEVARIAGVEPQALLAVDEAVRRDLIRISGRSLEFVHPLIRSAVHDVIAPARLAEFHTAAAALVDEPGLALRHRARAAIAPDERLAADLESVARRAVSEGNWVQAADFFSEAAELSVARADRERRLLDRAGALCDAGDLLAARPLLPGIHAFRVTA